MSLLPVDTILPELLRCLAECGGAVLEAPPGAGKSTRVPLALLAAPWRGDGKILLLEPRRVAARAVAAFMAERLGEPVGATVGYRTRLDSRVSHATVIEVVTEGVLTRLMLDDPSLEGYAAVLFDEFHERSLQADLGLALVQEVRQALRGELRLLVMSATLEVGPLAEGLALPVVRSEGRVHPVTVSHAPPPDSRRWLEHCAAQVRALAGQGTVLVFLPGVGEIDRLGALLADLPMPVETLHGRLQGDAQAAVLRNVEGQARVVLSTNVAETSVTIEGVTTVLDSGLERRPDYDPRRQRSRLVTRRISEASAAQRAGRAGRLGPGRCVRLWSRAAARQRLQRLGALGADGAISEWGARLAQLPLPPELAALVWLGREQGLPLSAARLAVLLSEPAPGLDREPDLAVRLNRFAERSGDWPALHQVTQRLLANRAARDRAEPLAGAGGLLAQAFPDRLARRREGEAPRYLLADGSGARLPPGIALGTRAWLVVLETDGDPREANIRLAWALDEQQARRCLDERGVWEERVAWDNGAQRVRARRVLTLGAIEVDSQPLQQPSAEQIQAGLLDGVRQQGLEALPWTPALRQWRARVGWMARLEPRQWPDTSDQALLANLEQWLGPFLAGLRSLRDLRKVALADALGLLLGPGQRQTLERQLPAGVAVASGRTAMIRYDNEGSPRLAVKLQECFGMRALPALAEGRVPLVVELLTPAGRPAAITADLEHFWRHGYPQVRKALRGRYPKHPWPDDPFSAIATSASKRRQ